MRVFGATPGPVIALALIGLFMGVPILFWILKRGLRRLTGKLQVPIHGTMYAVVVIVLVGLLGGGLVSLALGLTLRDYRNVGTKAFLAQVRCARVSPGHVKMDYIPIASDGTHGATDTLELTGDGCTVAGEMLRFRPFLADLGLGGFTRLTAVGGPDPAAPARRFAPSLELPPWLQLKHDGQHPLGYLLEDQQTVTVAQEAQENAGLLNLWATPPGYQLAPGAPAP